MVKLVNRAKMTTSTTGTGTITLGSAVDGFQTFTAAGVSNGETVRYCIEDGTSNFELGSGVFTASGTTLTRVVSESSNSNNAINLSGDAIVFITAIAADIQPTTFTTTVFTATANQTTFSVSYTVGFAEVFLNGSKLSAADFTATNGTSIVLASGAAVGDTVDVVAYATQTIANVYTQSQSDARYLQLTGGTLTGDLTGTTSTFSGDVTIADKIVHSGDTNTAIRFPAVDTFAVETDGSERLRVDSAGNVGINDAAPDGKLNVVSTAHNNGSIFDSTGTTQLWLRDTDAASNQKNWGFQVSGGDLNIVRANDDRASGFVTPIYIQQAPANSLVIDSGGNFGLGSTRTDRGLLNVNHVNNGHFFADPHIALTLTSATDNASSAGITYATSDSDNYGYFLGAQRTNGGLGNFILKWHDNSSGGTREVFRVDSNSNLLVGTTSMTASDTSGTGMMYANGIALRVKRESNGNGQPCLDLNNTGSDDVITLFRKDGVTVGKIGTVGTDLYIGTTDTGLRFLDSSNAIIPINTDTQSTRDDAISLGTASGRYDNIYATNGTINTSDRNEKQDIAELTEAERRVAVAAKGLLRKFRWKSAVASKGDKARTHFGIIAQDLQAAFEAEGLDAGDYAMFISSTWTDEETGEEKTRMGVRYSELLAFIIAAI